MARKGKDPKPPKKTTKKMTSPPAPKAGSKSAASKTTRRLASAKATKSESKATAAYDDLKPAPAPVLGDIPWGYGDNRICCMARDPQWAFVYWEITDDGIAAAKAKLQNPEAWISLRIYDTTAREFNGLNAHLHWDLGVDRGTNSYYFKAGKPGSTITVDIGVRSHDGNFYPIARSGPCEMPREAVSHKGGVEASTVLRSGPGFHYHHRYVAPPAPPAPPPGAHYSEASHPAESEKIFQHLAGEGWARSEWTESLMDGRVVRWIKWSGPVAAEHLAMLPRTTTPWRSIEVLFQGEKRIIKMESGEKIVYGPWKMTLEAVGPRGERRTVEQWMVKRRWTTQEGMIRVETPAIITRVLGGRRVTVAQSGSEARLLHDQWGSEQLMQGASEWRWIGASENMMQGSSETVYQGSSEMLYLGASETFSLGSSEIFGGASDLYGGSSEYKP